MEGWIKLHRKFKDWQWANDPKTSHVFIHILLNVNHKDGNWRGIPVLAGSFITGRKALSHKTGLSEREIRTSLKRLKSTSELTIKTTNKYSIISITNWHIYQVSDQQDANKRPASDQQATTNKNDNNNKNEKEDIIGDALPPKTPKQKKGSRLPDDWDCSTELGKWAMNEYGMTRDEVAAEIYAFIDYWKAKTGQNAIKLDWDATFRNWIRNNIKWSKK